MSSSIDFEALLSRNYQPARVAQFRPRPVEPVSAKKGSAEPPDDVPVLDAETLQASHLAVKLASRTPLFVHLAEQEAPQEWNAPSQPLPPPIQNLPPPAYHEVELGDWESKIDWGTDKKEPRPRLAPTQILRKPRNPYLDNLDLTAAPNNTQQSPPPLLLQLGVAGHSIATHVFQHTLANRPLPATETEAYRRRRVGHVTTAAPTQKDALEAIIAARQKKRAQMAKDKTSRVTEAMTGLLGGGRGRTITSSLMGPGGTERSGRPSRHVGAATHDAEYVEQLDWISNHSLVKDWSKVLLRQFHRPKLPLSVVRPDLGWQLQVRNVSETATPSSAVTGSYQAIMGTHPGALSKAKLTSEADLSPTEGKLILLEYLEERPPLQLSKGMAFKIVNYYRGDKAQCPVSAGGGDRPARRKREATTAAEAKNDRLPRLVGPDKKTTVTDWIGKLPKKKKERSEQDAIDILPEGVTEILHPKVHGPFIGAVDEGETVTGLVTNLFVAPMGRHDPEPTDFLMILTPPTGAMRAGESEAMGVVLRDLPQNVFAVGQTEPRIRVHAPQTQGEKNFMGPFVSYQIARALARSQTKDGHGLRFDEIQDRVLPNLELQPTALRQRLKQVALYDKNTQIWTTKQIGYEDYPGVEALGRSLSPESIAAFESACAASRRLTDLGIHMLYSGAQTVVSVGMAMVYIAGQLHAAREQSRKMRKLLELSRGNKKSTPLQISFYEKASEELEQNFKVLKQKHEVAQFIFEELQLAPWHLTGEFIDVHMKGEGTGMMRLTGLGDPSGMGEGFSFLREADSKPNKSVGNAALSAQVKKITGTEDDLRKLTMKQMASLLRSYGMAQKKIDTLRRWDRVHVIRDLSTKAASDGIGDGLERFARGEKLKLSEQKETYRKRIQVIWRRQLATLNSDTDKGDGVAGAAEAEGEAAAAQEAQQKKAADENKESDSDSDDDDDFAAELEEDLMDRNEANQIAADQVLGANNDVALGQRRAATQDKDTVKDASELAALRRQREEEKSTQERLQAMNPGVGGPGPYSGRKVIRKKIVKTHPDGRQTTTFKFVVEPDEVGKIMARLQQDVDNERPRDRTFDYERMPDERPPGQAIFEDEDDFEYSTKGRVSGRRRGASRRRGQTTSRSRGTLQFGKVKNRLSKEERIRKRRREEDELDVYMSNVKRKTTNNRRERGSIRERRPHVIFADKLESIRAAVEARPYAGPFAKPVNRRVLPRYYEVISHPIDLSTIRDKISRYDYRTADMMLKDFELMKQNAVKFNGEANPIAQEGIAIYEFVKDQINSSRSEFANLEVAVEETMSGKKSKKSGMKGRSSGGTARVGGVNINLGDLPDDVAYDDSDSGDESYSGLVDL